MKRITIISLIISFMIFATMDASLYAISIVNYTFTNDLDSMVCTDNLPDPMDTFNAQYDRGCYIYILLYDVSVGDTIRVEWYYQGELLLADEPYIFLEDFYKVCRGVGFSITNTDREYMTGYWSAEVYLNEESRMRDSIYLEGLPQPTTTTTSSSSTSSSKTTTTYSPGFCALSLIYGTDSAQTELLCSIRDNLLSKSHEGRELIKLYYQWSPVIVKAMQVDEDFKEDLKELVDGVLGMME